MTKYIEILTKACPLFAGFTAEETAAILTASHPRIQQLAKGEYLFHAGTKTDTAGIVLSGSVHIVRHDYQGSTVLLAELGPGNLFAESFSLANLPLTVSVTAGQDSAVLLLPVRSLAASSASAPARRLLNNMLQVFARKNVFLTERIEHLSQRTLREKRYISRDFAYLEVMPFITLVERVRTERHRFTGFLRFSDRGGVLYARFEPDNDIADLLLPHFARRLGNLPFLIHDARRGRFAAWDGRRAAVFTSEKGISEKDCGDGVAALWKSYFAAADVKERPHPRQQDGYLPRRYRKNMCEFSGK